MAQDSDPPRQSLGTLQTKQFCSCTPGQWVLVWVRLPSPLPAALAQRARGAPRGQRRARQGATPALGSVSPSVPARGCERWSGTERGSSAALLHRRRHSGLLQKTWHFGVWQHVCKEEKEEGKPKPCSKAAAPLLRVRLQPCPPSPAAGAMLPAPRPPSVCPSRCPFSLLAASSGRTISSRLMVTALASALKSMVPISHGPGAAAAAALRGRECCPALARRARSRPAQPSGPAKADPNEEVTSHL